MAWSFGGYDLRIELSWSTNPNTAPVWVDISQYVRSMTWAGGRSTELDQWQATTGTVTLDNRSGLFSSDTTSSIAGAGGLLVMRQMRARAITWLGANAPVTLWTMNVAAWPQVLDIDDVDRSVVVQLVDRTKALRSVALPSSAWALAVAALDNLDRWFKLAEDTGTVATDSGTARTDAVYRGGATFGATSQLVAGGVYDGAVRFDAGTSLVVASGPSNSATQIGFWFNPGRLADTAFAGSVRVLTVDYAGPLGQRTLAVDYTNVAGAGALTLTASGHVNPILWSVPPGTTFINIVSGGGSGGSVTVNGTVVGSTAGSGGAFLTTTSTVTVGPITGFPSNIQSGFTVDELIIRGSAAVAATTVAYGGRSRAAELTGARVNHLLAVAGVPAWQIGPIDTGTITQPALSVYPANLWAALSDTVDIEGGDLFIDTDGRVVFRDAAYRRNVQGSTTEFSNFTPRSVARVWHDGIAVTSTADQNIVNHVLMVRGQRVVYEQEDAASIARYLRRTKTVEVGTMSRDQAIVAAGRLLGRYREPATRIDAVTVNMRAGDLVGGTTVSNGRVCALFFGQQVKVTHKPTAAGTTIVNGPGNPSLVTWGGVVEGWSHRCDSDGAWTARIDLSPDERFQVDASNFLTLDRAGQQLGTNQITY